jgi:hypothetical protein
VSISIDPASLRLLERSEARAYRIERGGAMNAIVDVIDDQAIDGKLLKFNTPFSYKGHLVMLRNGCFGDKINHRVALYLDHEPVTELGLTDDAVSVVIDEEIAQFRVDLAKCRLAPAIARMVAIDNRSSTSVGCDILSEHREDIDGKSVRVVTRATLREVTICAQGAAGENAFCFVVSKSFTPPPIAGSRSATLQAAGKLHKVTRKIKALKASMSERHESRPPSTKRTYSLDELNRLASLDIERLQDRARQLQSQFG